MREPLVGEACLEAFLRSFARPSARCEHRDCQDCKNVPTEETRSPPADAGLRLVWRFMHAVIVANEISPSGQHVYVVSK